jgi:NADH-quinone oxidoreductase subunit M
LLAQRSGFLGKRALAMNLTVLLWIPLAAVLAGLILPAGEARFGALLGSLAALVYAIIMLFQFDGGHQGLQFVIDKSWISELGIHYKLGVDGLNLFLIVLATILFFATVAWSALREWERPRLFYLWLGLAESGVLGALMAQDLALFVIFFDVMLVPFLFLGGGWGETPNRVASMVKLFIYTLVGSLLMLSAAVATGVLAPGDSVTFDLAQLATRRLPTGSQEWIFLFFAAAFLVKMPAFPLHGWMPDGYKAMPLPVLAVFSGILSKVAAYGFLRIALPLYPDAAVHFQELILLIALASILYGSVLAFTTPDARLILGYSSVAQLGFITLGIFSLQDTGAQGALLQAVNHGLVVAPAFLILALLAARASGSEDIRDMGGIAFRAPVLAALFLIVALANLAMPGSSNFVGEFLILLGVFNAKIVIAIVAFTGVVLASVYTLRLFIRAMHNRVGPRVAPREISFGDALVVAPLVALIVALALYPQLALHKSEDSVKASIRDAKALTQPAREASR